MVLILNEGRPRIIREIEPLASAVMDVQWSFGSGLSYTTYEYSDLRADKTEFKAGDVLKFTVNVKNTGDVAGREPVLLFSSDLVASMVPDNRRLRAFDKVALAPGEDKDVTLQIKAEDLAFVNQEDEWVLEKGEFRIVIGDQAISVNCSETSTWK